MNTTCVPGEDLAYALHMISGLKPNYAINPTPELYLRSNRAILPARVIAALDPKWSNSVKYKSIKAMAHNWTHSFMSGANYVDGEWVAEDVYRLTRALKDQRVVIWWIPNIEFDLPGVTDRVRNALRHYRENLMVHLQKHQVEQSMVREMRTEVFVAENLQMQVWSIAVDDRGRTYDQYVGV